MPRAFPKMNGTFLYKARFSERGRKISPLQKVPRGTFLYPASAISPHRVHKTWAMSVCQRAVETPMGIGKFDVGEIPESDFLLLESLYCLPFAKKYKGAHPACKIISIIADTSFWDKKLTLQRRLFYKLYLGSVDSFIAVSDRVKNDIRNRSERPAVVVRPFLVNKYVKRTPSFGKNVLFIGNTTEEKGFGHAIEAAKLLPAFNLYLVGTCQKKIPSSVGRKYKNIHIEGVVPSLNAYLEKCAYYLHPADFDPSPVTVWEAMYAGLIPVVSKNVGQAELFKGELKCLVLEDTRPETIVAKLLELDALSKKEKKALVVACRRLASHFTEEKSVRAFKKTFAELLGSIVR